MELFVADAFTTRRFSGNQAGVALLGEAEFPEEGFMRALAGELKHSETTCVRRLDKDIYHVRYFSPVKEVSLSGHAALGTFWALAERGYIDGREETRRIRQYTKAGALYVDFHFADEKIRFVDVELPKMEPPSKWRTLPPSPQPLN